MDSADKIFITIWSAHKF